MLTKKQYELLVFIDARLRERGVSPSFDEMKDALNLKSKSGIHRLITALEERGFIRRLAHRARALEVVRLPDPMKGAKGPRIATSDGKVVAPDAKPIPTPGPMPALPEDMVPAIALPLHGRIAAGTPIEALADHSRSVDVPASMLGRGGEHYALEVQGDSMIEAGINDGDIVIIRRADTAENGTIVVALIDDAEATLKRLRRKGDTVALEPANANYETRIFGPDRVKVQGRLVGLYRRYH
ncbi:transcriptional repressor LexA [Zavarzinia compransoris]|uniref:transcriptional repressor LexA n=1 Tax=Zavarzinia marina TaxID=2911065 RepID=UPI001F3DFC75|nr:transcriptional repressor LexA [Zavarzinia marina]MCF4164613.1 transcriptional repressor LexA [Zavarzinia marina]